MTVSGASDASGASGASGRHERASELFLAARVLAVERRGAFLAESCGEDLELRREVESMLEFEAEDGAFLDVPAMATMAVGAALPRRIGRYRILERIGEGGMGVVYAAEQDNPRRTVALKVIRPAFASQDSMRRFAFESEVLGRLQHPSIAQVHEAGVGQTDEGAELPYIAMERVDGVSLEKFAAERKLTTRERVLLFLAVCDAVEHAHRKGVIHRDLKPANILVDREGRPRILDFGVARLAEVDESGSTMFTRAGAIVGTLAYMSPEQAEGGSARIDTRSDVYALGVILHELIAGKPLYALHGLPLTDALRVVRDPPASPLGKMCREARGDLETIVATALAKDPERRYASADALAADLRRMLADEPITARPPGAWYRAWKFTRRHALAMAAAVLILLALTAGLITTFWQARVAERQRLEAVRSSEEANAITDHLLLDMLGSPDPRRSGRDVRVVDLLDKARVAAPVRFAGKPHLEAAVHDALGRSYHSLGIPDEALAESERAVALRRDALGEDHAETLSARAHLVEALIAHGDLKRALTEAREVLAARQRTLGKDHPDSLASLNDFGAMLVQTGDSEAGLAAVKEAAEARERVFGLESAPTLTSLGNLGTIYGILGRYAEAEQIDRKVLEVQRRVLGHDHPDALLVQYNLAQLLEDQGRLPDAEAEYRELLAANERVNGKDHPDVATPLVALGAVLADQGHLAEATPLVERAYDLRVRGLGESNALTLEALSRLVHLRADGGDLDEASRLGEKLVAMRRAALGDHHPELADGLESLGYVRRLQKDFAGAAELYRESFKILSEKYPDGHPDTARASFNLGAALRDAKDTHGSGEAFERALAIDLVAFGKDHSRVARDRAALARVRVLEERYEDSESLARAALEVQTAGKGKDGPDAAGSRLTLGEALVGEGRAADAEPILVQALETFERVRGKDHERTQAARAALEKCRAAIAGGGQKG